MASLTLPVRWYSNETQHGELDLIYSTSCLFVATDAYLGSPLPSHIIHHERFRFWSYPVSIDLHQCNYTYHRVYPNLIGVCRSV